MPLAEALHVHVQMRGGGVTHGPHPRSHEHGLFRKMRRQGLACALSVGPVIPDVLNASV